MSPLSVNLLQGNTANLIPIDGLSILNTVYILLLAQFSEQLLHVAKCHQAIGEFNSKGSLAPVCLRGNSKKPLQIPT